MAGLGDVAEHWRDSATDDLETANILFENKRYTQALFFAHLAAEKMLKAFCVRKTREHAPYSHNLLRLAQLAEIKLDEKFEGFLRVVHVFNIEGRYAETGTPPIARERASEIIQECEAWLAHLMKAW